jgi:hypothetical protein
MGARNTHMSYPDSPVRDIICAGASGYPLLNFTASYRTCGSILHQAFDERRATRPDGISPCAHLTAGMCSQAHLFLQAYREPPPLSSRRFP